MHSSKCKTVDLGSVPSLPAAKWLSVVTKWPLLVYAKQEYDPKNLGMDSSEVNFFFG